MRIDQERLRREMELGGNVKGGDIQTVLTNWRDAERRGEEEKFLESLTPEQIDKLYEHISREAKELFQEHFFGPKEVENAFTLADGTRLVEFSSEQKREIIKNLRAKLNEPDIKTFLARTRERMKNRKDLVLDVKGVIDSEEEYITPTRPYIESH